MGHEDAAFEVGFGKDIGKCGGMVKVEAEHYQISMVAVRMGIGSDKTKEENREGGLRRHNESKVVNRIVLMFATKYNVVLPHI